MFYLSDIASYLGAVNYIEVTYVLFVRYCQQSGCNELYRSYMFYLSDIASYLGAMNYIEDTCSICQILPAIHGCNELY